MSVGSYAPSESDSTRNFDSFVITEALNLSLPQQAAAAAAPVVKQPEGVTSLLTTVEAAAASSAAAIQAPSPQIPCSPPTQAQSPQVR